MSTGLARSVQTRLVRHAKSLGADPNLVLSRYGTERLLYRLSRSPYADRFVLKGALLLLVWLGEAIRPTRDVDLLAFGSFDADSLTRMFVEIIAIPVEPDGLDFDPRSLRVSPIRLEDPYGGLRMSLLAHLGPARLKIQVDISIGDAVVPAPVWLEYPSLLDLPRPHLRAYCPETSVAEKLHAMVVLGSKNSRMRDFFDIHALASRSAFDGERLAAAVSSTFARRGTEIPVEAPLALTPAFAGLEAKAAQWQGYLRRSLLVGRAGSLEDAIEGIAAFLLPVLDALARQRRFTATWPPGGPWQKKPSEAGAGGEKDG